jgi:hypothetical protein
MIKKNIFAENIVGKAGGFDQNGSKNTILSPQS